MEATSELPTENPSELPRAFMNNLGTAEGPDALRQYRMADRWTMDLERHGWTDGRQDAQTSRTDGRTSPAPPVLVARDDVHDGRRVVMCCSHFSGGNKWKLDAKWLKHAWGVSLAEDGGAGIMSEGAHALGNSEADRVVGHHLT